MALVGELTEVALPAPVMPVVLAVLDVPLDVLPDSVRRYDHHRRRLMLSELLGEQGRAFSVAYQLALAEHDAQLAKVAFHRALHLGILQLHGEGPAVMGGRAMHLAQGGGGGGRLVEGGES